MIRIAIDNVRIAEFCRRWKIRELSFFGSVLREDMRPDSDVDVLVSFEEDEHWRLSDWVVMMDELREILDRQVDLVQRETLRNPYRRHEILRTREVVYAA